MPVSSIQKWMWVGSCDESQSCRSVTREKERGWTMDLGGGKKVCLQLEIGKRRT